MTPGPLLEADRSVRLGEGQNQLRALERHLPGWQHNRGGLSDRGPRPQGPHSHVTAEELGVITERGLGRCVASRYPLRPLRRYGLGESPGPAPSSGGN